MSLAHCILSHYCQISSKTFRSYRIEGAQVLDHPIHIYIYRVIKISAQEGGGTSFWSPFIYIVWEIFVYIFWLELRACGRIAGRYFYTVTLVIHYWTLFDVVLLTDYKRENIWWSGFWKTRKYEKYFSHLCAFILHSGVFWRNFL